MQPITSVANSKSEAISEAGSNATSAIAAFAATLDATYATDTSVANAKSEAITAAGAAADNALTTFIHTLLATSSAGTAENRIRFIASSGASGAVASIALEVNVSAGGSPSWQPTGLYLDAMSGFGRIRQIADLILFQHASVNGGSPFNALSIENVDGQYVAVFNSLVYMRRLIADTIEVRHIKSGQITRWEFASNTDDVAISSTTDWVTISAKSITINAPSGTSVLISVDGTMLVRNGSETFSFSTWRLLIGGTQCDGGNIFIDGVSTPPRTGIRADRVVNATGSDQVFDVQLQAIRVPPVAGGSAAQIFSERKFKIEAKQK